MTDNMQYSGKLDAAMASRIIASLKSDDVNILDFSGIDDVNFAAQRALLNVAKEGTRIILLNVQPQVVEKFEDSGVSFFINICRKPKPVRMDKYKEFGASFLSVAYNSLDGDSMIKIYGSNVPQWIAVQEKNVARAVMTFGINTPLVGTLYSAGEGTGLDFERIEGKRSFSRVISEQPERLEEMSRRFARMCKKLHGTPCDTTLFNDRTIFYRHAVISCNELTSEEKDKVLEFLDNVPAATTCLHGDMQVSNVITNEKEDLWIDLSDFGYGNPMFDMGMWYFLSNLNPEDMMMNLFHLTCAQMKQVFDFFLDEYFGADSPEKKSAIVAEIEKFAALHMIYLGSSYGFKPFMMPYIHSKLLDL